MVGAAGNEGDKREHAAMTMAVNVIKASRVAVKKKSLNFSKIIPILNLLINYTKKYSVLRIAIFNYLYF